MGSDNLLNPCPKCGAKAEMKCSCGGSVVYYGIYCTKCDYNNCTKPSLALLSHGLGSSNTFPPANREEAIREWNEIEATDE